MIRLFIKRFGTPAAPLGRWDHRLDWRIRADQATWDSGPGQMPSTRSPAPTIATTPPAAAQPFGSMTALELRKLDDLVGLAMAQG